MRKFGRNPLTWYFKGFLPDPGAEPLVYRSTLPLVPNELEGTGIMARNQLSAGNRGEVAIFNAPRSGLAGVIIPGMYTQPLSPRGTW